jgi:hypothetical protein
VSLTVRRGGSGGEFMALLRKEGQNWVTKDIERLSFIDGYCG